MKKFRFVLFICLALTAILGLSACGACNCAPSKKKEDKSVTAEIKGVTELRLKIDEGTDDILLEDVSVVLSDGTKAKPKLELDDYDPSVAGKYIIYYVYGKTRVGANVFVYYMPKMLYNNEDISGDTIEIT